MCGWAAAVADTAAIAVIGPNELASVGGAHALDARSTRPAGRLQGEQ